MNLNFDGHDPARSLSPVMTTHVFRHIAIRLLDGPAESVTDSPCRSEVIKRAISFQATSEVNNLEWI